MKLRPYKSCDAETIAKWVTDETVFLKWGGASFGHFPVSAETIDEKYRVQNGGCAEADNFYPWVALDGDDRVVGQMVMRYMDGDRRQLRFGWVIVDDAARGRGYGKRMLLLGLKYAFDFLGAERVTIGVFENNDNARACYKSVGFRDRGTMISEPWNMVEMEIRKESYLREASAEGWK